jgi:septum formation protein
MTLVLMGPKAGKKALILASSSTTRANILNKAGLRFAIEPPNVDEASVRQTTIVDGGSVETSAALLAEMKALEVSQAQPEAFTIGADQILECGGEWFEKPHTIDQARMQLLDLRGKRHRLISSVVVAVGGSKIWEHTDQAQMTMRAIGDVFLDEYIAAMGDRMFWSVGGYQLEGVGLQLFSKVVGNHYTILGLPLLPLLGFLRSHGILGN